MTERHITDDKTAISNFISLSDDPNRSRLQSSKSVNVSVPGTKNETNDRAFQVADPQTRNNLAAAIRSDKTLPTFKKQLKLHLHIIQSFRLCTL